MLFLTYSVLHCACMPWATHHFLTASETSVNKLMVVKISCRDFKMPGNLVVRWVQCCCKDHLDQAIGRVYCSL